MCQEWWLALRAVKKSRIYMRVLWVEKALVFKSEDLSSNPNFASNYHCDLEKTAHLEDF